MDPDKQIGFIFLSNRTYPSRLNTLLITNNIRQQIHQAIYNALSY
ncbi:hypothetical protein [Porphyromonas pogonae]|nr:hypothetical protein [Porphyromonas pogonae]